MRTQSVKSEPSSTSLYVNVGLEVVYNRMGVRVQRQETGTSERKTYQKRIRKRKVGMTASSSLIEGIEQNGNMKPRKGDIFMEGVKREFLRCL